MKFDEFSFISLCSFSFNAVAARAAGCPATRSAPPSTKQGHKKSFNVTQMACFRGKMKENERTMLQKREAKRVKLDENLLKSQ